MMMKLIVVALLCVFTQATERAYGERRDTIDWNGVKELFVDKWIRPYTSEGAFHLEKPFMDPNFNCTTFEDCSFNGQCALSGTICVCYKEFVTFEPGNGSHCNYERKKGLTALLLHIFLGNGVAHLYVDRLGLGLTLFFTVGYGFIVTMCILGCIITCCLVDESVGEATDGVSTCLGCLTGFAIVAVWIWLLVVIASNDLTDSNGVALTPV